MQISVRVRRQASRSSVPEFHTYTLDVDPQSQTVLDALQKIQWEQDGSLVFRRNCRNVICGSCGMRINGKSGLACQKLISQVLDGDELVIEPMANLPVIKDLIVDMTKFWQNLTHVDPYVATEQISQVEFRQTPNQREQVAAAANCILCGSCYSECNTATVNPDFVGPHALAKAYRVLADNRDDRTEHRITKYNDPDFVWGCTRCYNCNEVCPVEVQPLDRITQIKQKILQNSDLPISTAQRHRYTMVEMVKADGWIDESRFAVKVVANNFQDPSGFMTLVPLGIRMIARGKMPYPWQFQPSAGVKEIKSLITAIQDQSSKE